MHRKPRNRIESFETNTSFVYNTQTNEIKDLGDLNESKYALMLVNCLGSVYALGGSKYPPSVYNSPIKSYNTIEKLNTTTNKWEILKCQLIYNRLQSRAIAHNEFIYVFGGKSEQGKMESVVEKINTLNEEVAVIKSRMLDPRKKL